MSRNCFASRVTPNPRGGHGGGGGGASRVTPNPRGGHGGGGGRRASLTQCFCAVDTTHPRAVQSAIAGTARPGAERTRNSTERRTQLHAGFCTQTARRERLHAGFLNTAARRERLHAEHGCTQDLHAAARRERLHAEHSCTQNTVHAAVFSCVRVQLCSCSGCVLPT